ncbi:MAG: DMT family transporter [Aquabacterium sp.]
MSSTPAAVAPPDLAATRPVSAWLLGLLGVVIFALTLPLTRMAVGPEAAPQLDAGFVTFGRAALAGVLSLAWLGATGAMARSRWPDAPQWRGLAATAVGVVVGFPLFLALALRQVDASHAAVVTGVMPMATAVIGAVLLRQRMPAAFWAAAVVGLALVLAFAAWHGGARLQAADGLLLLAVLSGGYGYVRGAQLSSPGLPPHAVICWVLVLSLPLTLPMTAWTWPAQPAQASSWWALAYLGVFSMWLGFFAWYRALASGGTVRISQVQLLQPFLAIWFSVPLLGETLDAATVVFTLAIVATILFSRRAAQPTPHGPVPPRKPT